MSAEPVTATIFGQTVEGTIADRIPAPDWERGPRELVVVDVDGHRYRVEEDQLR